MTDFLQNPNRNPSEVGLPELLDKYLILDERLRRSHPTIELLNLDQLLFLRSAAVTSLDIVVENLLEFVHDIVPA